MVFFRPPAQYHPPPPPSFGHTEARRGDISVSEAEPLLKKKKSQPLPLVSEGFFPRSENTLASILSFFSAARAAGVSIADRSERKGREEELTVRDYL